MNEIRTLMEKFWICRDSDKETFYKVKRDIPNFQRFIREQLGWKLIHTEKLLKLEKRPAHAEAFMGISEFTDIRDYCILCVVLMYLEDAEEGRQFLLSELIDYVETQLKNYMPVDWTSFTQRKSLVRVLQYMERLQMLRVYEGKSESFSQEAGQEVLYENTGYSKYFTSSFTTDISGYESWKDFEKTDFEEFEENRGSRRINRVYRQLAVCPALYWDSTEDADALYLKNQRQTEDCGYDICCKKIWKTDICVSKAIRWWRSENLLSNRNGYFRLFYGLGTLGGGWKKGTTKDYFW